MGTYIPHTDEELTGMLAFLGLSSLDELFAVVPEAVKLHHDLELADGVGEPDVLDRMEGYADLNRARTDLLSTIKDLTAAVAAMPRAGGADAGSAPISSDANSLA